MANEKGLEKQLKKQKNAQYADGTQCKCYKTRYQVENEFSELTFFADRFGNAVVTIHWPSFQWLQITATWATYSSFSDWFGAICTVMFQHIDPSDGVSYGRFF